MVRIAGVEAVQDQSLVVGLAVAVGIFEEDQVGLLSDIDSAVSEFEPSRNV